MFHVKRSLARLVLNALRQIVSQFHLVQDGSDRRKPTDTAKSLPSSGFRAPQLIDGPRPFRGWRPSGHVSREAVSKTLTARQSLAVPWAVRRTWHYRLLSQNQTRPIWHKTRCEPSASACGTQTSPLWGDVWLSQCSPTPPNKQSTV